MADDFTETIATTYASKAVTIDIESLVSNYFPYARRLALSILDDPHEADDAVQDAFIAANRGLGKFRGEAEIKTWLTRIVINMCRGRLRKRKARQALFAVLENLHVARPPQPSLEVIAVQREDERQIWIVVDDLDERHRLVVILRYVHELSINQIAATLDISPGTVYSRLFYARRRLQDTLVDYEEASDGS